MAARKSQTATALQRQLTLVVQLLVHPRGMTLHEVQRAMAMPKSTFHRYLSAVAGAGIEIDRERVDGETRYSVSGAMRQALAITPEQLDALRVARRSLGSLAGTHVIRALDGLIQQAARRSPVPPGRVRAQPGRSSGQATRAMIAIDKALSSGRRVVLRYRGEKDRSPRTRTVDPVLIRHAGGHVYLRAFDA